MDPNSPVLRRFPLVARPRPVAKALTARVDDLRTLAECAERENDLGAASAVYNQAALIASDCGQPELARQWCHEHADAHLRALPLGVQAARHALEPLINLARLHIRGGNGDAALQLLSDLFQSISSRNDTLIDGYPLPANRLMRTQDDYREVRRWLWSVFLAEGARALTSAGRWQEAYEHLKRYNGIGQRMLDGRQVAVISHATSGGLARARAIISETARGEPWEQAVTDCLGCLCDKATGDLQRGMIDALVARYRRLARTPELAVFYTRLGLSILHIVANVGRPAARQLALDLLSQALACRNAYAARDVLECAHLAPLLDIRQAAELTEMVDAAGLGDRRLTITALEQLRECVALADQGLTKKSAEKWADLPPARGHSSPISRPESTT